jgi:hypothetical protein
MSFSILLRNCLLLLSLLVLGCSDDGPSPYGVDGMGSYCASNFDCGTGLCCGTPACGHGMCTYRCGGDIDCPYGSRCEGSYCFMSCRGNADCYVSQHCTPHGTCQY